MYWIDEIILGLIDTYKTNNPYELCDALNISVIKLDLNNILLKQDNSIYLRDFYGKEFIFIRNGLNKNHELFYLSHELGHAILQPNVQNSLNKGLLNIPKLEKQADYFAIKLININFNEVEFRGMTYKQIASYVNLPSKALKQLVNL